MMKKLKLALTIVQLFAFLLAHAETITPLKVGDKVPDIVFTKMLNHTASNGKLSDFAGKFIIIDMWFRACQPCVSGMRHLDSLQAEFKKDLQILPLTWEKKGDVERFWNTILEVKGLKMVQVVEDSLVRQLFPASGFPHQIWINKNGIVVAITGGKAVTKENVKKFILGEKLQSAKPDELDANVKHAIAPNINIRFEQNLNKIIYYSYFSSYRHEFSGMGRSYVDSQSGLVRITANNFPLGLLYQFAYTDNSGETFHLPTRIIRKDSNQIKTFFTNGFDTTIVFCYELMYKGSTVTGFGKKMIKDLDRTFNVESHEELADISCYIISPIGSGTKFREATVIESEAQVLNGNLKEDKLFVANKQRPAWLERSINNYSRVPILFEMGKERFINFKVVWNLDNLEQMNVELSNYDLKIEKAIRKRKIIILEDAK